MSVAPAQLAAVQAPGSSCESARKSPSRSHPGGLRDDCAQMWASAASKVPISGQAAHTGVYPRRLFRETGGGNGEPAAGEEGWKAWSGGTGGFEGGREMPEAAASFRTASQMSESTAFRTPGETHLGVGAVRMVGPIARRCGARALLVTGARSAKASGALDAVSESLQEAGVEVVLYDRVGRSRRWVWLTKRGSWPGKAPAT